MSETQRHRPLLVEVSAGELLDKISILRIKSERMKDLGQLANVRLELQELLKVRDAHLTSSPPLRELSDQLLEVNQALWDIEDQIRVCEAAGEFGESFIDLARRVYQTNDRRAALKRQINLLLASRLVEEKSYSQGEPPA